MQAALAMQSKNSRTSASSLFSATGFLRVFAEPDTFEQLASGNWLAAERVAEWTAVPDSDAVVEAFSDLIEKTRRCLVLSYPRLTS